MLKKLIQWYRKKIKKEPYPLYLLERDILLEDNKKLMRQNKKLRFLGEGFVSALKFYSGNTIKLPSGGRQRMYYPTEVDCTKVAKKALERVRLR